MAQNQGKGGRPPRADAPANDVLRVRLTSEERQRLAATAAAHGRPVADHVRDWINASPTTAPNYVNARARPGVEPRLWSRWTPRHVWTLHVVPGRPDGPVLCVRRRVLSDTEESGYRIETPGGDMSASFDDLQHDGHARGCGSHRDGDPFDGFDLAIDVYDHEPTAEERADWLRRHRLEQALIRDPPSHVWVTFPAERAGAPDRVVRCRASRVLGRMGGAVWRPDLNVYLPGYREPGPGGLYHHRLTVDLYELAVAGEVEARSYDSEARRVYLHKPSTERLRDDGRARAEERATRERKRAEVRATVASWFGGTEEPGAAAVRALGLDPATATAEDVQAAFRAKAKAGHADKGGSDDMGELVRLRDVARDYIAARG